MAKKETRWQITITSTAPADMPFSYETTDTLTEKQARDFLFNVARCNATDSAFLNEPARYGEKKAEKKPVKVTKTLLQKVGDVISGRLDFGDHAVTYKAVPVK